ncbi:hypothetical protein QQS21_003391 [Conoideocrella luteorostrata]|uniref:Uncharacterized protein n=1 Tax=Conoideocrella luteorostrata TaxID=1105319 RepID=A0AAJ0CW87_9HYPO|nr:hypothetical protein QQS21_003391 [Conoideocrella luteorostrata]
MRLVVDSTTFIAAALALSASPVVMAMPTPQSSTTPSPISSLSNIFGNIPFIGNFLGGNGAGPGSATNQTGSAAAGPGGFMDTILKHLPGAGSGFEGIAATPLILSDHVKYTANPPSALEPIPEAQNSPPRELHREAHAALVSQGQKPDGKQ